MTSWRENLCDLLNDVELSDISTYDSCFSRKLEFISQYPGRYSIFALDEKASQVVVLTNDDFQKEFTKDFHKRTLLLTPMPTLRITSLLLSVDGQFMAILTRTSVHVLDARYKPNQESDESSPIVKRIYCAFDCVDHITPDKSRVELLRVRWHPRLSNILVVLTTDSQIFFVQCSKLPGASGIGCRPRFHLDLGDFKRRMADVAAYSDTENVAADSDNEDSVQSANRSCSRLDLEIALGGGCVDFDFGAPVIRHSAKWRFEKDQALDCCVYLLCESGDIVQLSGCLTAARNPSHLSIRNLHILPPSVDNYGYEFCALLAFSSSYHPDSLDYTVPTETPPDVLVIANRNGLLYQGIVLQSTGRSNKRTDATVDGPTLCLVDVVDLHLHDLTGHTTTTNSVPEAQGDVENESSLHGSYSHLRAGSIRSESPSPRGFDEFVSLVLEPAHLVHSLETESEMNNWPFRVTPRSDSYPYLAYYVIHDAGLHMVRLPWLQHVVQWCRKLAEDPSISTTVTENSMGGKAREWHSSVKHLICAQLPLASTATTTGTDGRFRVSGLIELPLDPALLRDDSNKKSNLTGQNESSGTLFVVRAPDRPHPTSSSSSTSTISSLVIPVPIESIRGLFVRSTEGNVFAKGESSQDIIQSDNSNVHTNTAVKHKPPTPRSEFAVHLRRVLNVDSSSLPRITGLSLQTNLTQMQLVQFFLKATEILRSGPLQRLMRARTFVEQYTGRLADHLSTQYTEAVKLTTIRQELQQHAEQLTQQHATILERQQQLDKRLAALASRLAGLCDGPTKVDVGMHDEIVAIRDRLRKGLQKWFSGLRARHTMLEERLARFSQSRTPGSVRCPGAATAGTEIDLADEEAELKRISCAVRNETIEIKQLIDSIKLLNAKTNPCAT